MRRARRVVLPTICLAALLASAASASGTATAGRRPGGDGFPVTVQSADGRVRIPARPTRILSLSASATEMLYAIGAGHQVVGVDKYSTWPPNAPRTSFTGYESSAEDYLPLRPDLVVLAFDENHLVAQLEALRIPVLLLPAVSTIQGAEQQVSELGLATGHREGAIRANATIDRAISAAVASARGHGRGDTYYVEIDPTYYSATSRTFIGALFSRFGMRDIADRALKASSGYPQLSAEYVLAADPDYVFLADTICCGVTAKSFAARPGFSNLRAVRLGHVVAVRDSVASEWGPHSLEAFVAVIADVLDHRRLPPAAS